VNLVGEWAALLFHTLARAGVREVVISPGSRSTPLVLGAVGQPGIRVTDAIDERSAAFYALGQARATGAPSALVCTSGSAPAHYHPAVLEADRAGVPLLVLSADRPWELHEAGANQTVDQVKLFGGAVRGAYDIAAPEPRIEVFRALRRVAGQAVARTLGPIPGPVHVNLRFRKPLEPGPAAPGSPEAALEPELAALRSAPAAGGSPSALRAPVVVSPGTTRPAPDPRVVDALAGALEAAAGRWWLVAGPRPLALGVDGEAGDGGDQALLQLVRRGGGVLFPEATSQLRFVGPSEGRGVPRLDGFETFLDVLLDAAPGRVAALAPSLVLFVGAAPVSPAVGRFLDAHAPDARRIVVHPHRAIDPDARAETVHLADPGRLAQALLSRIDEGPAPGAPPGWVAAVRELVAEARAEALAAAGFTEASLAAALPTWLPEDGLLFPGNSLPVRVLDAFSDGEHAPRLAVASQRGTSGIDGLVSGAAGLAQAARRPTVLLVGDVSFQHDLGGLALAAGVDAAPLLVVVVRNGGGRIFEQLPVARTPGASDALSHFTTPNDGVDLGLATRAFGIPHRSADTLEAARQAVVEALGRPGATVIEVRVPGDGAARTTAAQRRALAARLADGRGWGRGAAA
jgi:2-succinyl-5-enolpyruvyl-6-hydroxy-3-cyclohexene-1-carboxylate synthase